MSDDAKTPEAKPTGTRAFLLTLKASHRDHSGNPGYSCDACKLMELVDRHRMAMERVLEMCSKNQLDARSISGVLQEGLGR